MGVSGSKQLEKALGDKFPENERFFGLENFGNTCYCNGVLQALYFCVPFREQLLEYHANNNKVKKKDENLLTCLADLFNQISSQKKRTGVIVPKRFVGRLKKQNGSFRGDSHQDAHEFLNFLLNELVDILERSYRSKNTDSDHEDTSTPSGNGGYEIEDDDNDDDDKSPANWVHDNFQGILTNETRCLRCENITARNEIFLDLSLDIEEHTSLTKCLKKFCSVEKLYGDDKFFCDNCRCLQEAEKRLKIKKSPEILVIHLKRFKFNDKLGNYKKLQHRVVFPVELKLNTIENGDSEYSLFAVVVHVGSGTTHGHYVSIVKSHEHWLHFDDKDVTLVDESILQNFYGSTSETSSSTHGYILFYQKINHCNT